MTYPNPSKKYFPAVRYIALSLLLITILFARCHAPFSEFYARQIYPYISRILSAFSAFVPFSMEELTAVGCVLLILTVAIWGKRKKRPWYRILFSEIEICLWMIVWFYWGWGINYFRQSFYERRHLQRVTYQEEILRSFVKDYTHRLNESYLAWQQQACSKDSCHKSIQREYDKLPDEWGLAKPQKRFVPKALLFNDFYSQVGVLGYMGPFFSETQLNLNLQPQQYAFTYAHELAHLLGVSSEAEANYWAYRTCTSSPDQTIQFSGYYGILPYVAAQVYAMDTTYYTKIWIRQIHPDILRMQQKENAYWQKQYAPWIGKIQNFLYEAFLKGNKISDGQKNYGQVVAMILSEKQHVSTHK